MLHSKEIKSIFLFDLPINNIISHLLHQNREGEE